MRVAISAAFVVVISVTCAGAALAAPAKGEGPTVIEVAFGSVWIGTGDGRILRFDARTAMLQAHFEAGGFIHSIESGFGSVWVLGRRSVFRIDPQQNRVRTVRETRSVTLFRLAAGSGGIWIADDGRDVVDRIDPSRSRRSATVRVPGHVHSLAAGAHQTLVVSVPTREPIMGSAGTRLLRRIDPVTNAVSRPLVRLGCDPTIAITTRAVWTTDQCAGLLVRRDPRTLKPTARVRVGRWQTPTIAFGSVWLFGNFTGARWLTRMDLATLRVTARIRASVASLAVGERSVWLLESPNGISGRVREVDPSTNRVIATFRVAPR